MKLKFFILAIYLFVSNQVNIAVNDKCDADLSQQSYNKWSHKTETTMGLCTTQVVSYVPYCSTISKECAQQRGCALVNSTCVPFAGCSAYMMNTTSDCQAISIKCRSDDGQCTESLECSEYSKEICESAPSKLPPYKCKLDGDMCRNYYFSEAEITLTTDQACDTWLSGCKTTGQGCIDIIPSCSSYIGTTETCKLMKGTDGVCEFDSTRNMCQPKQCRNTQTTNSSDSDCEKYKIGCVTTGKGCIDHRRQCSSYFGDDQSCKGFIGTDGHCAGDIGGTECRARMCNEKIAITDQECDGFKLGCVTNGKTCVNYRTSCSSYQGTEDTCQEYIGSDGYCQGTSNYITACSIRDCFNDSIGTENTDALCQLIQPFCKTTGKGCTKMLKLCSNYSFADDGTSCLSLIGLEGKCKVGNEGKCAALQCSDAPKTATTNKACNDFLNGYVTTGRGCEAQQTCSNVSFQQSCEENNNCEWSASCVAIEDCSSFKNKSQCNSNKINSKTCFWDTNYCRITICEDFVGNTDIICDSYLSGCVSNGTNCIDGTDCSKFNGVQQTFAQILRLNAQIYNYYRCYYSLHFQNM